MQAVAQFQLKAIRQTRINGSELGKSAAALLGFEMAQIGDGKLEATTIQIRIHMGSSASGSHRSLRRPARRHGQISS